MADPRDLQAQLAKRKSAILQMIPNAKVAERLYTIMLREMTVNPALQKCSPKSVLDCAMESAKLGLEIGGPMQQAHLVPYGPTCTLIIGYRGLVELVKRGDPRIHNVTATLVRENDVWSVDGHGNVLHDYDPFATHDKRGALVGGYCRIEYGGGLPRLDVPMNIEELDHVRSMAKTSKVWEQHLLEMYKKTLIRRGLKTQTLSPEVTKLVAEDDARSTDLGTEVLVQAEVVDPVQRAKAQALAGQKKLQAAADLSSDDEWLIAPPDAEDLAEEASRD